MPVTPPPPDFASSPSEGSPPPAFLGVTHSVGGRCWVDRGADDRVSAALAQSLDLPEVVARVLAARGVLPETAPAFLSPTLRELLPDPNHLLDMDRAAERLARAVEKGETIGIFADYDVDGATSAALLQRFFRRVGARAVVHIPDRLAEGYGPNESALLRLHQVEGASVILTVDCGITAHAPLHAATAAGIDMLVVDHHMAESRLPPALAVVNPNRLDESSPHRSLAAVGVAFLLVVAINRRLRTAGWYGGRNEAAAGGRSEPDLRLWLDLVALGTVCDVVPLTGLNRVYVYKGLKVLAARGNPGLAALADLAKIDRRMDAYHLGFVLGPRINAGGRVGRASAGSRLLATDDPGEAARLAEELEGYNQERKLLEDAAYAEAVAQIEEDEAGPDTAIIVASADWHQGVIGIVAGRLKERYHRPVCAVALAGDQGRGSGRSIPGIPLGSMIIAARQAGLLLAGGGHDMAAGFTLEAGQLAAFKAFLIARIEAQIGEDLPSRPLKIDGLVGIAGATAELVRLLGQVGPFGMGNAEPRFALAQVHVAWADVVGERHVRCQLRDQSGARLKGIAFRAVDTPLGSTLLHHGGLPLHIAGHLRPDTWQGRDDVQLFIEDAAMVTSR